MKITKEKLNRIENHYILTKNRSGSTLLNLLLQGHSEIQTIHEENTYWLLYSKYSNVIFNSEEVISQFLKDFFFTINVDANRVMLFAKTEMLSKLKKYIRLNLKYREFINLFQLHYFGTIYNEKKDIRIIINKELNFSSMLSKMHHHNMDSKYVFLIRDCYTNIRSSIEAGMGSKNIVFQSVTWKRKNKYFVNPDIPKANYHILFFEDLINNKERELKKICNFFKVTFESAMLNNKSTFEGFRNFITNNHYDNYEAVNHLFEKQHKSSLSNESLKSKISIDHYFSNKDLRKINLICYKELNYFGYLIRKRHLSDFFLFTPVDIFYLILAYQNSLITNFYFSSQFGMRKLLRMVNVFSFFRSKKVG